MYNLIMDMDGTIVHRAGMMKEDDAENNQK